MHAEWQINWRDNITFALAEVLTINDNSSVRKVGGISFLEFSDNHVHEMPATKGQVNKNIL